MGVKEGDYQEFKRLNTRLIQDPLRAINKISNFIVRVDKKKQSRRIVAIKFYIEGKKSFQIPMPLAFMDDYPELEEKEKLEPKKEAILQRLIKHGIEEETALKLVKKYDNDRLEWNISNYEKNLKVGKADGEGWLVKAIKVDYRPKKSAFAQEKEERRKKILAEKRRDEALKKEIDQLAVRCDKHNRKVRMELIRGLSESKKAELDKKFKEENDHLKRIVKKFNDGGLEDPMVKNLYLIFVGQKYPDVGMSLKEYAEENGAKKEILKALSE